MDGTRRTKRVHAGRSVEAQLVEDHLALVHYAVAEIASKIPRHVSRDDLISAAMSGLAHAARNFEPDRGIRFDRYASTRIRGALLDELRNCDWASRSVRTKARRLGDASEQLSLRLGRVPTSTELANHLGCSIDDIATVTEDVHRAVVLNYESLVAQGNAEEIMPADQMTPDRMLLDRERQAYLVDAVAELPHRLRQVVLGYFFEERSMQELADELGVSESRISQMRSEALELLRDGLNAQLAPELVAEERTRSGRVAKRKVAYYDAIAGRRSCFGRISGEASLGSLTA